VLRLRQQQINAEMEEAELAAAILQSIADQEEFLNRRQQ